MDSGSTIATFVASIRSVGTAVTLAGVGVYLHRRGFVGGEGKRTLAKISQQVTIPLFLFTKIIYCNQDWSSDPCPNITDSLRSVWMLLIWPVYVVSCGIFVGYLCTKIAKTPKSQTQSVLAACGFGNSTGLPITLLTVVHTNFPATSDLGSVDPTLFLSVYLLLYPVLQWGMGGWLLSPDTETKTTTTTDPTTNTTITTTNNTTITTNGNTTNDVPVVVVPTNKEKKNRNEKEKDYQSVSDATFSTLPVTDRSGNDGNGNIDSSSSRNENDGMYAADEFNGAVEEHTKDIKNNNNATSTSLLRRTSASLSKPRNVLNNKAKEIWYKHTRVGMSDADASLYLSDTDLLTLAARHNLSIQNDIYNSIVQQQQSQQNYNYNYQQRVLLSPGPRSTMSLCSPVREVTSISPYQPLSYQYPPYQPSSPYHQQQDGSISSSHRSNNNYDAVPPSLPFASISPTHSSATAVEQVPVHFQQQTSTHHDENAKLLSSQRSHHQYDTDNNNDNNYDDEGVSCMETLEKIASRCLQPPVIGAILGIVVASTPLRGIFIDLEYRSSRAALQWLFDGLYEVGETAVPINMIILGCNLSASQQARKLNSSSMITNDGGNNDNPQTFSLKTTVAIVIGKMFVMPLIGILSVILLREYVFNIPDDIAAAVYLVMMIVFITPTANNVMVMVELSGSNAKQAIASCIALQYAVAPLILSITMSIAVGFASSWS